VNQLNGRLVGIEMGTACGAGLSAQKTWMALVHSGARLGDAMHGDHVPARAIATAPGRWLTARPREGRISRARSRARHGRWAVFRYRISAGNTVAPYDRVLCRKLLFARRRVTPELRAKWAPILQDWIAFAGVDGAVVNGERTSFPRGGVAPEGRVIEIIGRLAISGWTSKFLIRQKSSPAPVFGGSIAEAAAVAIRWAEAGAEWAGAISAICRRQD